PILLLSLSHRLHKNVFYWGGSRNKLNGFCALQTEENIDNAIAPEIKNAIGRASRLLQGILRGNL
ncbi:unnamed protein product, partial [Musa hybrid cultivar]